MMKKILIMLTASMLLLGMIWSGSVQAAGSSKTIVGSPDIEVLVKGRKINFQGGNPMMESGRVLVPFRSIGEALDADIDFSGKKVSFKEGNKTIQLTLGSNVAIVDGKQIKLDAKVVSKKGRTYVPLRFIIENLGEDAQWDNAGNWVWIGEKKIPTPEEIGIKNEKLDKYSEMIGEERDFLLDKKKNARVFTKNQLPLKIGDVTIYDVWTVKQGDNTGIQVRYSGSSPQIYYLTKNSSARYRQDLKNLKHKNSDGTITLTYTLISETDSLFGGVNKWKDLRLNQIEYIGFDGLRTDSLEIMKNPFK